MESSSFVIETDKISFTEYICLVIVNTLENACMKAEI
jgi:hypothetical protein